MKNTRNFEDIQKAHSMFLANVMSQTFLLGSGTGKKNPVNFIKIIYKIQKNFYAKCHRFNESSFVHHFFIDFVLYHCHPGIMNIFNR